MSSIEAFDVWLVGFIMGLMAATILVMLTLGDDKDDKTRNDY